MCLVAAADTLLSGTEKQEKDKRKPFLLSSTNVTKPAKLPAADVQTQLDGAAVEEACLAFSPLEESTGWPAARCHILQPRLSFARLHKYLSYFVISVEV